MDVLYKEKKVNKMSEENQNSTSIQEQDKETLDKGMEKSSKKFLSGFSRLFGGNKKELQECLDELLDLLLMSDMTVATATTLIDRLRQDKRCKKAQDISLIKDILAEHMVSLLSPSSVPLQFDADKHPSTVLVMGVNGAGKTTTIGKIAHFFHQGGMHNVLIGADTFRAAATDQLKIWAERTSSDFVQGEEGADPASVAFRGCQLAMEKKADIAWIDTAGRLQNKKNLMDELSKVVRIIEKVTGRGPDHVLLILDAGIGKNAIEQVKAFHECVPITGLIMTKLDGTAKGGMLLSIASETNLPIHFIGLGEKVEDLQIFDAESFVKALLFSS